MEWITRRQIEVRFQPWFNPLWLTGLRAPTNLQDRPWILTRVTQVILGMTFLVFAATVQYLNYRVQAVCSLHIRHPWPWNKVKVVKPRTTNADSKQGYNHAKFERSRFDGVREKANVIFFSNEETCQLSLLNMCDRQNQKKICSWSTLCT